MDFPIRRALLVAFTSFLYRSDSLTFTIVHVTKLKKIVTNNFEINFGRILN